MYKVMIGPHLPHVHATPATLATQMWAMSQRPSKAHPMVLPHLLFWKWSQSLDWLCALEMTLGLEMILGLAMILGLEMLSGMGSCCGCLSLHLHSTQPHESGANGVADQIPNLTMPPSLHLHYHLRAQTTHQSWVSTLPRCRFCHQGQQMYW